MHDVKVFICLTPFSTFYVRSLITHFRNNGGVSLTFIATQYDEFVDKNQWDHVHILKKIGKKNNRDLQCFLRQAQDAKNLYEIIKNKFIFEECNIDIYIQTLDSFYTNRIFFEFKDYERVRFYALQDGTMNVFSEKINPTKLLLKHIMKLFISRKIGHNFYPFFGCYNGIDRKEVIKQFLSFFPSKYIEKTEVVKLVHDFEKKGKVTGKILIIGSEPHVNIIGYDKYLESIKVILSYVNENFDVPRFIYKLHPLVNKSIRDRIITDVKKIVKSDEIEFLESNQPIEFLDFSGLDIIAAYGVNSSALINIGLMHTYLLDLGVSGLEFIYKDMDYNKWEKFYRSCNVRILNSL